MKQLQLTKFVESRRSKEGSVDVRAETAGGEMVQINFSPDVSEQILWGILSLSGQTYANDWTIWPLSPDLIVRARLSDGSMELRFVRQNRAAVAVQISPTLQQTLREALDMDQTSRSTARTGDPH